MGLIKKLQHEGKAVLAIDTGMTPRSFAQSSMPRLQSLEGFIISPNGEISSWHFEGTRCNTDGNRERMEFWGPLFDGESLLDIILKDSVHAWNILHQTISSINKAIIAEKLSTSFITALGSAGPMAIIYGNDNSILLLPGELCSRCTSNHGAEKEIAYRLAWIHPDHRLHNPMRAISFMAGVCAYRILSGKLPFEGDDLENMGESLSEKMRNGIFEELLLAKGSLKPAAAQAVDSLITATSAASTETLLAFGPDISVLYDPSRAEIENSETFIAQRESAKKKRNAGLKRKQFFRKRRSVLMIVGIIALIGSLIGLTMFSDIKNKPNTKNMNTSEIVLGYYKGIENLDQEISTTYAVKGLKTDYDSFITNLFVTSKMREAYERNGGLLSPAELYVIKKTNNRMIYGITRLHIQRIGETDSESQYTASFYLWMPYTEEQTEDFVQLSVYSYEDKITLKWVKDRWLVSDIQPVKRILVESDGKKLLEDIKEDRADGFPWSPTLSEIQSFTEQNGLQ
ncbi:MAG TPA: hypothetical protein VJ861_13010 [Treponemataceae bacterium]|nr:hypothetical protein [Treponemataceae bacterium]